MAQITFEEAPGETVSRCVFGDIFRKLFMLPD